LASARTYGRRNFTCRIEEDFAALVLGQEAGILVEAEHLIALLGIASSYTLSGSAVSGCTAGVWTTWD